MAERAFQARSALLLLTINSFTKYSYSYYYNHKGTKNYWDYQLLQRLSYPELRLKGDYNDNSHAGHERQHIIRMSDGSVKRS